MDTKFCKFLNFALCSRLYIVGHIVNTSSLHHLEMFQVVKTATKLVDLAFFGHSTYVLTWFVIAPIQFLFGILYCVYVGVYESKFWEW